LADWQSNRKDKYPVLIRGFIYLDSTKLNVNNSPFSNRFCQYHIPCVGKILPINFRWNWSTSKFYAFWRPSYKWLPKWPFICWPIDFKLTHKHYIRNLKLKFENGQKMSAKTHQNFKVLQFQRKLIFRRFSTWGIAILKLHWSRSHSSQNP
jgi:hypothetical protein